MINQGEVAKYKNTVWAIVLANLIPLLGVMFWGWKVADIMFLYWFESAIIGFYSLIKIPYITGWGSLFYIPFFTVHYSGFMIAHLVFLVMFFITPQSGPDIGVIDPVQIGTLFGTILPAVVALFVSHGYSFKKNFLGKKEYQHQNARNTSLMPYSRIVLMHIVIILTAFFSMLFNEAIVVLVLMVIAKMLVDIRAHIKLHEKVSA